MRLEQIYLLGGQLINELIRKELRAQGHFLTGNLERSLEIRIAGRNLACWVPAYGGIVNIGLRPSQINYKKLYGPMVKYFQLRGLDANNAMRAAHFTILKWQKEGMPTQASKRFSSTGSRKHFVESAFTNSRIDEFFLNEFDRGVDEEFSKTKNETV